VILATENLFVLDKDVLADALVLYAGNNIDFLDAYNAVFMKYQGLREIYSYDEDFETIDDFERKEPLSFSHRFNCLPERIRIPSLRAPDLFTEMCYFKQYSFSPFQF
jgi:hypothetical protein